MRLLNGSSTLDAVRDLLKSSGWARIAVAYWGDGAVARLGIEDARSRGADVQIALDLSSGACNPQEVRHLLNLFGARRVRAVQGLHAKLWLTEAGVVIGSSNASANGFGHEGEEQEVTGLIEANLLMQALPASIERDWQKWFDRNVWREGAQISPSMMREAERRWRDRRVRRGPASPFHGDGGSLLDRMRREPGFFRDKALSVWVHSHDGLSATATRGLKSERKLRRLQTLDCYEGCRLTPGEHIIDLEWDVSTGHLRFDGLWKVLEDRPNVRLNGTSISLIRPVSGFDGFSIQGERAAWRLAVKKVLQTVGRRRKIYESAEAFAERLSKI